jgi:hypothetical protein
MARSAVALLLLFAVVPALGKANKQTEPLALFSSAKSVYITSPSGDEFGMFPLPEDKEALIATRRVIANGRQVRIVYAKEKADIIVVVSSRASKAVIQVFDSRTPTKCLWHLAGRNGLRGVAPPLAKALEAEFENARNNTSRLESAKE